MITETYIQALVRTTADMGPRQLEVQRAHLALIEEWYEKYCRVPDGPPQVIPEQSNWVPNLQIGGHNLSPREVGVYKKYLLERLNNVKLPL